MTKEAPAPAHTFPRTVQVLVSGRSLLWTLALVAGIWLAYRLWTVLVVLLVTLVLVGTLRPFVMWLERHRVPRQAALVFTFILMFSMVALIGVVTIPVLLTQLGSLLTQAPELQARAAAWLSAHGMHEPAQMVLQIHPEQLRTHVTSHMLDYSRQAVIFGGVALTIVFLALYLIADRERVAGACFAPVPRRFHLRLARILLNLETIVGGYVRGQFITSALMTAFVYVLLTALGVPDALAFAVFAGFTDVLPFIGGMIATVPVVIAAGATGGSTAAIIAFTLMIVYQEIESRLLVPQIYGKTLRLPASAVIIALLVGFALLGVLGALLSLPVAAGLRMIAKQLRLEMPGDDSDETELRDRDEQAEATYQRLSAGAEPQEAAHVAAVMAEGIRAEDVASGIAAAAAAEEPIAGPRELAGATGG